MLGHYKVIVNGLSSADRPLLTFFNLFRDDIHLDSDLIKILNCVIKTNMPRGNFGASLNRHHSPLMNLKACKPNGVRGDRRDRKEVLVNFRPTWSELEDLSVLHPGISLHPTTTSQQHELFHPLHSPHYQNIFYWIINRKNWFVVEGQKNWLLVKRPVKRDESLPECRPSTLRLAL